MSVRALGKLTDPANPERGRRRVQRHLSGRHAPSEASITSYAEALGVPSEALAVDDDELERPQVNLDERLTMVVRELRALQSEVRAQRFRDRSAA